MLKHLKCILSPGLAFSVFLYNQRCNLHASTKQEPNADNLRYGLHGIGKKITSSASTSSGQYTYYFSSL